MAADFLPAETSYESAERSSKMFGVGRFHPNSGDYPARADLSSQEQYIQSNNAYLPQNDDSEDH